MRRTITLSVLAAAWLLWSGLYEPLLLGLGAASCLLALYLSRRMGLLDRDVFSLDLAPRLPPFWIWLLKEIARSSLDVARIVLTPKLPISPTVVELDAAPRGPVGQAILGNSITLTPGTLTLDVDRGRLRVHCLTRATAEELLAGEMNRRVAALTGN